MISAQKAIFQHALHKQRAEYSLPWWKEGAERQVNIQNCAEIKWHKNTNSGKLER